MAIIQVYVPDYILRQLVHISQDTQRSVEDLAGTAIENEVAGYFKDHPLPAFLNERPT